MFLCKKWLGRMKLVFNSLIIIKLFNFINFQFNISIKKEPIPANISAPKSVIALITNTCNANVYI